MKKYLARFRANAVGRAPARGWAAAEFTITGARDGTVEKKTGENAVELQLSTDFDLTIPRSIGQWLARLLLLYRVPFTYLVADERMLPPYIRFFHLDPGLAQVSIGGRLQRRPEQFARRAD